MGWFSMSAKPIGPDSGLQLLVDDGYRVEIRHQHLLLHDVPYVTASRQIDRGTLICTYVKSGEAILVPDNHQVWWTGEYPCYASGAPIEQLRNEDQAKELFPECFIRHRFSNKPDGLSNFSDHYTKLVHYVTIIQSQAQVINPVVNARGEKKEVTSDDDNSPFMYADSASARAEIQAISNRLALK